MSAPTIVVVGGGYAGARLLHRLEQEKAVLALGADLVLIDEKDHFFHNIGAPRALVDDAYFAEKMRIPYSDILRRARLVQGRVVRVAPGVVHLASGETVAFDFAVLATGSAYWFKDNAALDAKRAEVAAAEHVLVVGGGASGVEVAGEIAAALSKSGPARRVTLVHSGDRLLRAGAPGAPMPALHVRLLAKLRAHGVDVRLGTRVTVETGTDGGAVRATVVGTDEVITADAVVLATGERTASPEMYAADFGTLQNERGQLATDLHMRLRGHENIFVVGDLADNGHPNMAHWGGEDALNVVLPNLIAALRGARPPKRLGSVVPIMLVQIGPRDGASQFHPTLPVFGKFITSRLKGRDMVYGRYRGLLTYTHAHGTPEAAAASKDEA